MQVTINRVDLLDWLSVIEKALPGKASIAIIEGIYMSREGDSLTLCSNSLEMAIRLLSDDIGGEGEGKVILPRRFIQIIKQLPGDVVKITVKDNIANIKSDKSEFKLNCINDAGNFPLIDEGYIDNPFFEVDGQAFKEMIAKTTFCVGNTGNHVFQSVCMSHNERKLTCMSSDTHRLAWYEKMQIDFPGPFEILVPGKILTEIGKIISNDDNVKVYVDNAKLVFVIGDYIISLRLMDGKFPALGHVFPAQYDTRVTVERQPLIDTLTRARLVANKQNETISLIIDDNTLAINSQSEMGKMNEELPISIEGVNIESKPMEQLFINAKYLIEGVKVFDNEELCIDFHGTVGAVVIRDEGFKYLALPINHNN